MNHNLVTYPFSFQRSAFLKTSDKQFKFSLAFKALKQLSETFNKLSAIKFSIEPRTLSIWNQAPQSSEVGNGAIVGLIPDCILVQSDSKKLEVDQLTGVLYC